MFSPARLEQLKTKGARAALCTVVHTSGSTPRKAGAAMVVHWDESKVGKVEGTVGGGIFEHEVRRHAIRVLGEQSDSATTRLVEIALTTDLGMCCGGSMKVFIEPLETRPAAFVFGAGHVGKAVCRLACTMGFRVTLLDPREELLSTSDLDDDVTMVNDYDVEDITSLSLDENSYVLVVTHDHPTDQLLVEELMRSSVRTLGMIGSMRKAALTRDRCRAKGFSDAEVARLVSPVGLDIHAETPEEIALSIVAQWVLLRRDLS
ncbi:MAG: xanthine dehydrogenase accessory protein XdhC [Deltaproteobacteria bacterium]|nr:xanthine dehydrogenase accessory protein XdhC [Deltaproteobacteria bacterium]